MRCAMLLFVLLSVAFAPAPVYRQKPKPPKDEREAILGRWKLISRTFEGQAHRHAVAMLEVGKGRWTYTNAAGSWRSPWTFTLDVSGTPWRYHAKSEKQAIAQARGVCVVKGDKLTMCFTTDGEEAPEDLDGTKPGRHLDVYERIKPGAL